MILKKIISGGVNNVLVMGIPDLSLTPYGKHSDEKESLRMKASLTMPC